MMYLLESISNLDQQALEGSYFDDIGTMVMMRMAGTVVMAVVFLLCVFYPLYLLSVFLIKKFRGRGGNKYLNQYNKEKEVGKEYAEYIKWTEQNGYPLHFEPLEI